MPQDGRRCKRFEFLMMLSQIEVTDNRTKAAAIKSPFKANWINCEMFWFSPLNEIWCLCWRKFFDGRKVGEFMTLFRGIYLPKVCWRRKTNFEKNHWWKRKLFKFINRKAVFWPTTSTPVVIRKDLLSKAYVRIYFFCANKLENTFCFIDNGSSCL